MNKKTRADRLVVEQGLAETRQKAQALIMAGLVFSSLGRIEKPGQMLEVDLELNLKQRLPYVSRGGLKLTAALSAFDLSVENKIAADLGASTGGFTDCLLQRGAARVYAVDVDPRQLDWHLREDPRVILIKKNARYLSRSDFPEELDLITMDLSFISIIKILPATKEFLGKGRLLCLVKPQFEAGRGRVGKKGIVRDLSLHQEVLNQVVSEADSMGFKFKGLVPSPIRGQKGNREFFIFWTLVENHFSLSQVRGIIKKAVWDEKD